jgi:hypothetical protein
VNLESALHQSRYLSDSGRLFFNSADALVPSRYESHGASTSTSPMGGQLFGAFRLCRPDLLGEIPRRICVPRRERKRWRCLLSTTANLVPQDVDQSFDVYDAHECTSESPCAAPSVPRPPCDSSTSGQGSSSPQTSFGAPTSATLNGSGNIVQPLHQALPSKVVKLARLAKALKACRRLKHKKTRAACERGARKKYGGRKASKRARKSRGAGK